MFIGGRTANGKNTTTATQALDYVTMFRMNFQVLFAHFSFAFCAFELLLLRSQVMREIPFSFIQFPLYEGPGTWRFVAAV